MQTDLGERAVRLGQYILETGCTVRACAYRYKISKSTVHKDVSVRLKKIDSALYASVRQVLDKNRNERHIRGGESTRLKYLAEKELTKTAE